MEVVCTRVVEIGRPRQVVLVLLDRPTVALVNHQVGSKRRPETEVSQFFLIFSLSDMFNEKN